MQSASDSLQDATLLTSAPELLAGCHDALRRAADTLAHAVRKHYSSHPSKWRCWNVRLLTPFAIAMLIRMSLFDTLRNCDAHLHVSL
eukprot:3748421-Pleurochrysis_carterae.AAC.1